MIKTAALFLSAILISWNAEAKLFLSEGKDPRTGKYYAGLAILSEDARAQLHFQCTDSTSVPRIVFNNLEEIAELSQPFLLLYSVDDGEEQSHYFLVENNPKRGTFYVRHPELYGNRFGLAPEFIDKATGQVSMAFRNWIDNIHHVFVSDFADGKTARVTIAGANELSLDFSFDLRGFGNAVPDYMPCMDPAPPQQ